MQRFWKRCWRIGKWVPPQASPAYAEYDRLREEIESLQREIGAGVGADFDPVTWDAGEHPR